MINRFAIHWGFVCIAASAGGANAQSAAPERFALLEQRQVAFICSYALQAEAMVYLTTDGPTKTGDNVLRHLTASRVWGREAMGMEPASAKRWQVGFDGQSQFNKQQQLDFCYGAGISKLQNLPEVEADLLVNDARNTMRKLLEVRERYGR